MNIIFVLYTLLSIALLGNQPLQAEKINNSVAVTTSSEIKNSLNDEEIPNHTDDSSKKNDFSYLEKIMDRLTLCYKNFDYTLDHLFQLLMNGKVKSATSTEKQVEFLAQLRLISQQIQYQLRDTSQTNIVILAQFLECLIERVNAFIKSDLKDIDLEPIKNKIDTFVKRSQIDTIDPEKIENNLTYLDTQLKQLSNDSVNIGITRFNIFFRKLEKFWVDYKMNRNLLIGVSGAFLTYWLLSRPDNDTLKEFPLIGPMLKSVKNFKVFGKPIIGSYHKTVEDATGALITVAKPKGWLPELETNILGKRGLNILNLDAIPYQVWPMFLAGVVSNNFKNISNWVSKKLTSLKAKLRGEKEPQKVDGMIMGPRTNATYDDIIGMENLKNDFKQIIEYLIEPARFARTGISIQHYLFCGKTRSGKTFFAEATYNEIQKKSLLLGIKNDLQLIIVDASLLQRFGGLSELVTYIRYVIGKPAILVIDEIDMMGWQREKNAASLSDALTTLSGINDQEGLPPIMIIGLTNLPEELDSALLQPGRFGKKVYFDYPSYEQRFAFITQEIAKRGGALVISEPYMKKLALETEGYSFEDIRNIIISGLKIAKGRKEGLTEAHLEEALDVELRGIIYNSNYALTADQKQLISTHLAGTIFVTAKMYKPSIIAKATIRARNKKVTEEKIYDKLQRKQDVNLITQRTTHEFGGIFLTNKNSADIMSMQELEKQIKILVAGSEMESLAFGHCSYSYKPEDSKKAFEMVKTIVLQGINFDSLSEQQKNKVSDDALALLKKYQAETRELLVANSEVVKNIAEALNKKLVLTSEDIQQLIGMDLPALPKVNTALNALFQNTKK